MAVLIPCSLSTNTSLPQRHYTISDRATRWPFFVAREDQEIHRHLLELQPFARTAQLIAVAVQFELVEFD